MTDTWMWVSLGTEDFFLLAISYIYYFLRSFFVSYNNLYLALLRVRICLCVCDSRLLHTKKCSFTTPFFMFRQFLPRFLSIIPFCKQLFLVKLLNGYFMHQEFMDCRHKQTIVCRVYSVAHTLYSFHFFVFASKEIYSEPKIKDFLL